MAEKSDFIPISTIQGLKVTSREDSTQNHFEQQHGKKKHNQADKEFQRDIEQLGPDELMEYGSIILNKLNTELKLFTKMKERHSAETNEVLRLELEANLLLLEKKIDMYNKELQKLELKKNEILPDVKHPDLDLIIKNMTTLYETYKTFLTCVREEHKIINMDDIDFLDNIIKEKDEILDSIDNARRLINFDVFKNIPPKNKKKIKADQILSDIHNIVSEIIKQEDENRVELQALMEKMKLEIKRQDRGAKAISQFAPTVTKSHFIDTKK